MYGGGPRAPRARPRARPRAPPPGASSGAPFGRVPGRPSGAPPAGAARALPGCPRAASRAPRASQPLESCRLFHKFQNIIQPKHGGWLHPTATHTPALQDAALYSWIVYPLSWGVHDRGCCPAERQQLRCGVASCGVQTHFSPSSPPTTTATASQQPWGGHEPYTSKGGFKHAGTEAPESPSSKPKSR